MNVRLTENEQYSPSQEEALDSAVSILLASGLIVEEIFYSGLPAPRRPKRPR